MAEGFKELKENTCARCRKCMLRGRNGEGSRRLNGKLAKEAAGDAIEGTAEEEQGLQEEGNPVFLGHCGRWGNRPAAAAARAGRYTASARQRTSAAPGYCQ